MVVKRAAGGTSHLEVLDRVLDKGIVIDAWVRVSLVGIDLIASVATYLQYGEVVADRRARARAEAEVALLDSMLRRSGPAGR